jgi:4-amino-4-deoxy-L-arabinose transferase-like glycosyltransferase
MHDIRRMTVSVDEKSASAACWNHRILMVIAVGVVLRLIVVFGPLGSMPQMGDGPAYVEQARSILSGTVDHFYFPPGTAFFTLPVFALAGFSLFSEHLAGFLIGLLFLVSTVFLAQTILASSRAVFIAALISAVYPHVLLSTAQISSLPLAASLVSLSIASAVRARRHDSTGWWFACGLACSAVVLVRPGTLLLPVVIVAMTWFSTPRTERVLRRIYRPFVILGMILATFCLPVGLFHASRGHGLTLATNSEWNVLLANNAHTPDYKTGHFGQRAIADLDTSAQAYIRQFFTAETAESATVAQRRLMLDSAQAYMLDNPLRTLWRMSNRVRGFFGCDYTAAREMQLVFGYSDRVFASVMAVEGGLYLLVLLGWLFYLVVDGSSMGLSRAFQIGVLLSIMAPHILAFSLAKYHLPFVPVMICATAAVFARPRGAESGVMASWVKRRNQLIILLLIVVVIQVEHLLNLVWYR